MAPPLRNSASSRASLGLKVPWIAIVALVWGVASTDAKDDEWIQVQSENFVVTTNAGEKNARRLAKELETVRIVFRVALRGTPEGGPPLDVLAAKNGHKA